MRFLIISINQQDLEEFKKAPTDISAIGVRYLSAYLKGLGHEVNILFLCKPYGEKEDESEIAQVLTLIKNLHPDLVGISLMSNHFFRAVALSLAIKKNGGLPPVIWGGIHPTIRPKECLDFADMVCVGEGELAMGELLASLSNFRNKKIRGIWYKEGGEVIEGGAGLIISDLNSSPYPDYDLCDHYIVHQKILVPMEVEIFRQYFPASRGDHRLISTRGCPHACTYCCSPVFKNFYGGGYLRRRSVDNFIGEMVEVRNKFPFIRFFKIMDDTFAVNDIKWLREFSEQYKYKVNVPFFCNVSPLTINEEKLDLLVEAGLRNIQIGLQSGSDQINSQVYLRHIRANDFLKADKLFEKYKGRLRVGVDVIVDNPYEQEEDLVKTIDVLGQIKKPFTLTMFSLVLYPGTGLYQRAMADKSMADNNEYLSKQYQILQHNVLNKIIYLTPHLARRTIDRLTDNRQRLLTRLYIETLYFIYTKKNKLPLAVLKLAAGILKRLVSTTE